MGIFDKLFGIFHKAKNTEESEKDKIQEFRTENINVTNLIREIMEGSNLTSHEKKIDRLISLGMKVTNEVESAISSVERYKSKDKFKNAGLLCEAIGKIGGEKAFDLLKHFATDTSIILECTYIRNGAIRGFAHLGDQRAIPLLMDLARNRPFDVDESTINDALGTLGSALPTPSKRQLPSAEELSSLQNEKDIDGLIELLKHDEDVRIEAVLGEIGDARAIELLIQTLSDKSSRVRFNAADKLGKFDDKRAKDHSIWALEQLLSDKNEMWSRVAVRYLFERGGIEAIPSLTRALKDNGTYMVSALALGEELMKYRKNMDEERLREALLPANQYLINKIECAEITSGARSYDDSISLAITALKGIGDLSSVPVLESLLNKVKNKIEVEGMVREYVDNGRAVGYISPNDNINHIESAIESIVKREKIEAGES